jgi:DnaK suppressor protein
MTELASEDIRYFQERLRTRRNELVDILRAGLATSQREKFTDLAGEVYDDVGDQSVAELLRDLQFSERARELGEFRDVVAALDRIRGGVYGICVDCGIEIPRERLEVDSTVARCVTCQQRYERRVHGTRDVSPSL